MCSLPFAIAIARIVLLYSSLVAEVRHDPSASSNTVHSRLSINRLTVNINMPNDGTYRYKHQDKADMIAFTTGIM